MRELTQVEYQYLWPDIHRNPKQFADFLIDYNLAVPKHRQVNFHCYRRGSLEVTLVYREELPVDLNRKLDHYETTLPQPFIGGAYHNVYPITTRRTA